MHYLIVPGLNNSGPTHWQTFWTKSLPDASRVYQRNWEHPVKAEWIETLDETVAGLESETILVSHSLGVITTVHWLQKKVAEGKLPSLVKAVFLVAPADADAVQIISDFAPVPLQKLPVPSCVVASENDIYVSIERARQFADAWGSTFVDVGCLGHINADSNLGEWEQGRKILAEFEKTLGL
ncbi:alpha/beta hydrolase [uncultured Fibrobacter sp.]|uniref:RBBP9/YdeN family alpha/beta hydrolase n=1 Tax=uncultured Fibrobacter sp. TaxID=261512 RepID=UPI002603D7CC|nr:alpha/beta hydrolase [uncultured Fibrobacter sp.]